MNDEIVSYITQARSHKIDDATIRKNLLSVGWDSHAVEEAFNFLTPQPEVKPEVKVEEIAAKAEGQAPDRKKVPKKTLLLAAGVCVVILAGAGIAVKAAFSPDRVFRQFSSAAASSLLSSNFSVKYIDGGQAKAADAATASLKNLSLEISGNSQNDNSNPKNPLAKNEVNYTVSVAGNSTQGGIQYLKIGPDYYVNFSDSSLLAGLIAQYGGTTKADWVKFSADQTPEAVSKLNNAQLGDDLKSIWSKLSLFKEDKYLGSERINGKLTYHYALSLDKKALEDGVQGSLSTLSQAAPEVFPKDASQATTSVVTTAIERAQIKKFEIWIGVLDKKPYRISFNSTAPSVVALISNVNPEMSRVYSDADLQRLSDIRDLSTGLALYFNDNGGYPAQLGDLTVAAPSKKPYLDAIPNPPPADQKCVGADNSYAYTPTGKSVSSKSGAPVYPNYKLTFCLGADVGIYKAGLATATPDGISTNGQAPTTSAAANSLEGMVQNAMNEVDYSGQVSVDLNYDYPKSASAISAPQNFVNFMDMFKQQ